MGCALPVSSELKRTRYLWLKRPARLTDHQRADLAWLRVRSRGLRTARAYSWKLAFDPREADQDLQQRQWVVRYLLPVPIGRRDSQ